MGDSSHLHDAVLAVKVRELILNLARLSLHEKDTRVGDGGVDGNVEHAGDSEYAKQ